MFLLALWLLAFALLLWFQRKLIYFPRCYSAKCGDQFPKKIPLSYRTNEGKQTAYYIPAENNKKTPDSVWVLFGGNASLAMSCWTNLVNTYKKTDTAFLLVDYPGYGYNAGNPSKHGNSTAATAAYEAMLAHLKIPKKPKQPMKINVLGYSLGSGVAVDFALHKPVQKLLLLSPFTSMRAMVRKVIPLGLGWVLQFFLLDAYDVKSGLKKLFQSSKRLDVNIMHGDKDKLIPLKMSRELKETYRRYVKLKVIPDADHNSVCDHTNDIISLMQNNMC